MSLLFPERILIALAPTAIGVVQVRGHKRAPCAMREAAVAASPGEKPWQRALDTLHEALESWTGLRGKATVVLSSAFVRYGVVPHAGEASAGEERMALARAHFVKVHGERARHWVVRVAACARGEPGLAAAVDAGLIEGLKACFSGRRVRLASIQPHLMSVFNFWRSIMPAEGAWLVLAEPERICVALLDGRQWRGVSVTREAPPDGLEACIALVRRERARLATKGPPLVLTTVEAAEPRPAGEWQALGLPFKNDAFGMALTAA